MEVNYSIVILVILLIVAVGYIAYMHFYKNKQELYEPYYQEKHVRFDNNIDKRDNMSFLDPNYEQRRIEEMKYDMM